MELLLDILDEKIGIKADPKDKPLLDKVVNLIKEAYQEITSKYSEEKNERRLLIMTMFKLVLDLYTKNTESIDEVDIDFMREISDIVVTLEEYLNIPASEEGETQH